MIASRVPAQLTSTYRRWIARQSELSIFEPNTPNRDGVASGAQLPTKAPEVSQLGGHIQATIELSECELEIIKEKISLRT